MDFEFMERRIIREYENKGDYPATIALTDGQFMSLNSDIPFCVIKDLDAGTNGEFKFMGVRIVIVDVV